MHPPGTFGSQGLGQKQSHLGAAPCTHPPAGRGVGLILSPHAQHRDAQKSANLVC